MCRPGRNGIPARQAHRRPWHLRVEVGGSCFFEDAGGERAEPLAVFDPGVEDVLHVWAAGVGEDAAIAQGAWAPLHAALEPAYHFAIGDELGGLTAEGL